MTKNNNFDDDILIDQPEIGCYYHTNMFRFPEEELYRPQPPMKSPTGMAPSMMNPPSNQNIAPSMMNPPANQNMAPTMMKPSGEPAMSPGMMQGQGTPPMSTMMPPSGTQLPTMDQQPMLSPTLTQFGYTQSFLRTLIGRNVRVSFLIGTSLLVDRVGTLIEVGVSYIVLKQLDANINVMADLYAIKFVDIYATR